MRSLRLRRTEDTSSRPRGARGSGLEVPVPASECAHPASSGLKWLSVRSRRVRVRDRIRPARSAAGAGRAIAREAERIGWSSGARTSGGNRGGPRRRRVPHVGRRSANQRRGARPLADSGQRDGGQGRDPVRADLAAGRCQRRRPRKRPLHAPAKRGLANRTRSRLRALGHTVTLRIRRSAATFPAGHGRTADPAELPAALRHWRRGYCCAAARRSSLAATTW